MDQTREGLAKLISDLLDIAKVAMPPKLLAEDPRVKRAKAYLVALGEKSDEHRVPNTGPDPLEELIGEIVDLRPVSGSKMVLEWDLVDGVLAARRDGLSEDDGEALNAIVRDWLIGHGYLPAKPAKLEPPVNSARLGEGRRPALFARLERLPCADQPLAKGEADGHQAYRRYDPRRTGAECSQKGPPERSSPTAPRCRS